MAVNAHILMQHFTRSRQDGNSNAHAAMWLSDVMEGCTAPNRPQFWNVTGSKVTQTAFWEKRGHSFCYDRFTDSLLPTPLSRNNTRQTEMLIIKPNRYEIYQQQKACRHLGYIIAWIYIFHMRFCSRVNDLQSNKIKVPEEFLNIWFVMFYNCPILKSE